jgi:hypothetical protein
MTDGDRERGKTPPPDSVELPPRLQGDRGPPGERVRRYLRRPHGASEERAWRRLEAALLARPAGRPSPAARAAVVAAAAVAAVGGSWLLLARRQPDPDAPALRAPFATDRRDRASTRPAPAPVGKNTAARSNVRESGARVAENAEEGGAARTLAPGVVTRAIEPGRWIIPGEVSLELSPSSVVRAEVPIGGMPALSLLRGRIALNVVAKPRPRPFRLIAGRYAFVVLGTKFVVDRRPTRIGLAVSEGKVAVVRAGRRLATVSAGGTWSSAVARRRPPVHPVVARADRGCPEPGPGQPRAARLPCLRGQAAEEGLPAQTALFHIARITLEELRDRAAALATFQELRRRFPHGPLRAETDLFIVQLLAATGRYREALEESAVLLAQGRGPERAAELRLLRGNLYREALGDLPNAEREYRLAAEARARLERLEPSERPSPP